MVGKFLVVFFIIYKTLNYLNVIQFGVAENIIKTLSKVFTSSGKVQGKLIIPH